MDAYKPDYVFWNGALRSDIPLVVGGDGRLLPPESLPPGAKLHPLPGRAAFPGLVNGHSHAFQRLIRGRTEYLAGAGGRDDFWSWRERMYQAAESMSPEDVYVASRQAFVEMARAGVTSVGEFHYLHHQADGTPYADRLELARQVVRAAREVGLRICLLRVGYARAGHNVAPNPRQRRFIDARAEDFLADAEALQSAFREDAHVSVGVAPHSVRAVPRGWLEATARVAGRFAAVHMHVSEQPKEIEACLAESGRRPVELLADVGLLSERFTAVHGIHLSEEEVGLLGRARAFVCACPSTEANLGDGVVPADALYAAGARLSLGSDSQAHVDLLEEARKLEDHLRLVRQRRSVLDPGGGRVDGLAARLFATATEEGAASLGQAGGVLAPGRPADFFTVDLAHPSLVGADEATLLPALVFGATQEAVREVMVGGRWVLEDGRHPLQAESARAFTALSRRLYA